MIQRTNSNTKWWYESFLRNMKTCKYLNRHMILPLVSWFTLLCCWCLTLFLLIITNECSTSEHEETASEIAIFCITVRPQHQRVTRTGNTRVPPEDATETLDQLPKPKHCCAGSPPLPRTTKLPAPVAGSRLPARQDPAALGKSPSQLSAALTTAALTARGHGQGWCRDGPV